METKEILKIIQDYDDRTGNQQRFWQILFNLWITEFSTKPPEAVWYTLKDIYNDSNETIAVRILKHSDDSAKLNNTIYK